MALSDAYALASARLGWEVTRTELEEYLSGATEEAFRAPCHPAALRLDGGSEGVAAAPRRLVADSRQPNPYVRRRYYHIGASV
ncbi:hypothetical protein MTO96_000297 [Rhipicephalus appendiculatus]